MGILGGHFAMLVIVSGGADLDVRALAAELEETRDRLGLAAVSLSELEEERAPARPQPTHIVSVYGADHPGIVHAVAFALARAGVNITDVSTRLLERAARRSRST